MSQEAKIPVFTERFRLTLLERRVLVLDGVLDDDNGTLLAAQFLTLADEDPAADIALWINSPGGSVPSMLAIRDVRALIPCDVATLAFGIACSAGQFLLSAGTHGKRFALPHARILMHQGSAGIGGSPREGGLQGARPGGAQGTGSGRWGSARTAGPPLQKAARHEQLHDPERHRRAPARRSDHGRLLASADR